MYMYIAFQLSPFIFHIASRLSYCLSTNSRDMKVHLGIVANSARVWFKSVKYKQIIKINCNEIPINQKNKNKIESQSQKLNHSPKNWITSVGISSLKLRPKFYYYLEIPKRIIILEDFTTVKWAWPPLNQWNTLTSV